MKGEFDKAIADCTEAIRLNPQNAEAYWGRGHVYKRRASSTRRLRTSQSPFGSIHDMPKSMVGGAYAYAKKGEFDKAIADYNEAIRLDPKHATTYYNRGLTYGKKGDHDKAIADFTEAIRLNPKDAEAYYSRGCTYGEKGDHDKAITDYTAAIRINPKNGYIFYARG